MSRNDGSLRGTHQRSTNIIWFERESFCSFNQLIAHLPRDEREAIWDEAEVAMQVFEGPQGFQAPCEPLLVVGVK